jgi:hypothetical protein
MTTVRESLDALPVAELAEVREKLRVNAEEREALEATAKRLLEAWAAVAVPPPPPPQPAPTPQVLVVQAPVTYKSLAERAVATVSSNAGRSFSAVDLAQLWSISHESDLNAIRSGLSRAASRGWIRRASYGRYTSVYSDRSVR